MEQRNNQTSYQSDGTKLWGYAAVWDSPTIVTQGSRSFTEIVKRGAFAKSLAGRDILCCYNHDPNRLLGRSSSGTLSLKEDDTGLLFEVELPETQLGAEIRALATRGDLQGASFAFTVSKDVWEGRTRELHECELYECGPVVTPYYEATQLGFRSNMKRYKAKLNFYQRAHR